MNARSVWLLIGLSVSTLALAAEPPVKAENPPAKADSNACMWFSSIDDWRELDNRNLIVWVSRKEFYHVELGMPLTDLGWTSSIAFVDHNRDGRLCGYGMDEIVVPHSTIFGSSTIMGITRLDDARLAQLAEKYHVKLGMRKSKDKDKAEAKVDDKADATPAEAQSK
jgi:Family of unknown function (DUF6491)